MSKNTAKDRYQDLALRRQSILDRARRCAEVTIPSLLPPEGTNQTTKLPEPYQGLGARVVTYLSARLTSALYPPGQSTFTYAPPLEALIASGTLSVPTEMDRQLALAEGVVNSEIERRNWRQPTTATLMQLIVTGNGLEYMAPDNTIKSFRFDSFVVVRDVGGNVIEVLVKQSLHPSGLTGRLAASYQGTGKEGAGQFVDFYMWSKRTKKGWVTRQELDETVVPDTTEVTPNCPFMVYRWTAIPGEDYGRGKIEEMLPDFTALEGLSKAMLDLAAMNARNLILVRPNATGNTLRKFVAKADNGDTGIGNAEDVQLVKFENVAGAQIIAAEIQRLSESIGAAFLLGSGVRRDAERVTATEIRAVAEELEGTLGGVFSMLSEDMIKQRLIRLMRNMEQQKRLPPMTDFVETQITVGLEALRREKDASKVQMLLQILPALPTDALDYVPWPDLLKTLFIGVGLPGKVLSEEEVQQVRQNRMVQQMAQQVDPVQAATALLQQ